MGKKASKTVQKIAAGYVRLSLEEAAEGTSIASQTEAIKRWCAAYGHEVEFFIDDGASASKPATKRPGYQALVEAVERGEISHVVVRSADRLDRRAARFLAFDELCQQHGATIVAIDQGVDTGSETGRMMLQLLAVFAGYEARAISGRQKHSQAQRRKQGRSIGPPPYGFTVEHRDDGAYRVINNKEAKFVRQAAEAVMDGSSIQAAAVAINDAGSRTHRGGIWKTDTLGSLLRNPSIAGMRHHNGELVTTSAGSPIVDKHLAILSLTEWRRLQRALKARSSIKIEKTTDERLLLQGIAVCGTCGSNLLRDTYQRANGERLPQYRCGRGKAKGCKHPVTVVAHLLDDYVISVFDDDRDTEMIARIEIEDEEAIARREALAIQIDSLAQQLVTAPREQFNDIAEQLRLARDEAANIEVGTITEYVNTGATRGDLLDTDPRQVIEFWIEQVIVHPPKQRRSQQPLSERVEVVFPDPDEWEEHMRRIGAA